MEHLLLQGPLEGEHLILLAGSLAHVFDYLNTGSTRAALRAQLLLDRLDASAAPGSHAAAGCATLRQVIHREHALEPLGRH